MRILTQCLAMLSSAALLAGCVNEEPNYAKKPDSGNGTPTEVGYLSLSGLEMKVIYDGETETMPDDTADASATRAATPQVDDFIVEVYNTPKSFGRVVHIFPLSDGYLQRL